MTEKQIIYWDFESLSEEDREDLVSDILGEDFEIATVSEVQSQQTLQRVLETDDLSAESSKNLGPNFADLGNPQLILIILNTGMLCLEVADLAKKYEIFEVRKEKDDTIELLTKSEVEERLNGNL